MGAEQLSKTQNSAVARGNPLALQELPSDLSDRASIQRVASAVGEGAMAVRMIHQRLRSL